MSKIGESLLPFFQTGSAFIALGMVCFLTYNILIGMYSKDKYIQAVKYCFTFAVGYFILKSLIGSSVTISLNEVKIEATLPNITRIGGWIFHFDRVILIAKSIIAALPIAAAASITSAIAIIYAGMALHIKLSMNAWRGVPEVFEAFFYGVIAYFCFSHFDLFYNGMTSFLDSIINSFVAIDIYQKYSDGLSPIFGLNGYFKENINSFNMLGSFTNTISLFLGGITLAFLFIMDVVNLLLFFLQHIGILMLPVFTIAISFFSGIDPTRPLKLAGAFASLTLLAKLQVIILNLVLSSFENVNNPSAIKGVNDQIVKDISSNAKDIGTIFQNSLELMELGISISGDNFLLILKFCTSIICVIILIIFVSTKVLDRIFGIIITSQMKPFFQHTKAMLGKFRR
ncbi:hypothetical protein [Spirobacillus cienkowskii]|uniref:hypothetical protein n=1 Tax=Spirobacillus cienkowskii TaxID=495820 RepID=UPI0030D1174E